MYDNNVGQSQSHCVERKKPGLKCLHTLWLHLYVILEKAHNSDREQISGSRGRGGRSMWLQGAAQTALDDDGASPYLNCSGGYTDLYLSLKTEL